MQAEGKSHASIAFVLLCGLAVCCSVMYMTADGSDEFVQEYGGHGAQDEVVRGVNGGTSVHSVDVLKAGQIISETPDGRMRLMDYFNNVEKEISIEIANRRENIHSVRAQMARDFAFNAAARKALKKEMLARMSVNAKLARDHLNHAMFKTQRKFARTAALANRRHKRNQKRHKKTMHLIKRDAHNAAKRLSLAVSGWQKATSAWAASTNAKITQMNKHVAANAAQIVENQKRATKDLQVVQQKWTNSVNTFSKNEKNSNSRLSAQFAAQDKAARAYAANKIAGLVATSGAQFADVEAKRAKNRHEVDMALKQVTMRFEAALNAQKALQDQRYAQTVANIASARAEAKDKVAQATRQFKVGLLQLGSKVAKQVSTVNDDIDKTAGVVRSDLASQAKVNANVNAEMSRMVKLGNKRYREHLKNDAKLAETISKDNDQTNRELNAVALDFNTKLHAIRNKLKADRKHAETSLKTATTKVFAALKKQSEDRKKKNGELESATRRAALDAMDNIRKTKESFKKKIMDLSKVVTTNDKKADKQILTLTGVVKKNAEKDAEGRKELRILEQKNLDDLKLSIHNAIQTGENRAKALEAKGAKMDKDMVWMANHKLETEITKLREETTKGVSDIATANAAAREQLRREMMFAVNSAAKQTETDLTSAMEKAAGQMTDFSTKAAASHAASTVERAKLAGAIADNAKEVAKLLADSLATASAAVVAQKLAVSKAIKATDRRIDAYGIEMQKNVKSARAEIAALEKTTVQGLIAEQKRAADATADFSEADAKRQAAARKFLDTKLAESQKAIDAKFGHHYKVMAADRIKASKDIADGFIELNKALAIQSAMHDGRWQTMWADIEKAKKENNENVKKLRGDMGTEIRATTATLRKVEGSLNDKLAIVTDEVAAAEEQQKMVNRKVTKEMKRIEDLQNERYSEDARARGKLRKLFNENKAAAQEEVAELGNKLKAGVDKINKQNALNSRAMRKDLTQATEKFTIKLLRQREAQAQATTSLNAKIGAATVASANALAAAKKVMEAETVALVNVVAANAATVDKGMRKITKTVSDIKNANDQDRAAIRKENKAAEDDLNAAVERAVSLGEAMARENEDRINAKLKNTKKYLQKTLVSQAEDAVDAVYEVFEQKRQSVADNYLSLKAYSVASKDGIEDYVSAGKGLALSSVGFLVQSISGLSAIKPKPAKGVGMGGKSLKAVFSGKPVTIKNAIATINGVVNEYTSQIKLAREQYPMGLGKYLLDKLDASMQDKGVLEVGSVKQAAGNHVYINGRAVGLSNKLNDFNKLAAKMVDYEDVLAKMAAKVVKPPTAMVKPVPKVGPPEWQGN